MDWTAVAVASVEALGGGVVALGGLLAIQKRRRNGRSAEHCNHCIDGLGDRVKYLEARREEYGMAINDLRNDLRHTQGHAERLEEEADELKADLVKRLDGLSDRLDAVLARVLQIPARGPDPP